MKIYLKKFFFFSQKSSSPKDGFTNCKDFLGGTVQLQWNWEGDDHIKFKLSGRISEKQWVALGKSERRQVLFSSNIFVKKRTEQIVGDN